MVIKSDGVIFSHSNITITEMLIGDRQQKLTNHWFEKCLKVLRRREF